MDSQTSIIVGNYALIGCCVVYLIWWSIAFNPRVSLPFAPKLILFLVTLAAGIAGIAFIVGGIANTPGVRPVPTIAICISGIALYVLLLFLTSHFLHRQVTTELFLIVGWVVLELCVINTLFGSGSLTIATALVSLTLVLVMAAIGMACYLSYYNLEEMTAFFVGMVPLVLFAVAMLVMNLLCAR